MKKTLWNNNWNFSDRNGRLLSCVVDLPHDAMLLEERVPGLANGSATGYFPGGYYVYEKALTLSEEEARGRVALEFEGVYQKSKVFLNGELLGGRIYGYSDFLVDLSGKVRAGDNVVRVESDNTQIPNSRWYSGSGIYRDVWLWTSGVEYIQPYGVKLLTKSIDPAVLSVSVSAVCGEGAVCRVTVKKDGKTVAEQELSGGNGAFSGELSIPDAKFWTAETPELYDVEVALLRGGEVLDCASERTGLRTLAWNARQGFLVNGESVKLRGGCVHHDHGLLGAKSFKDAELRRARIMKEAGFNAVRYAHNPAGHAFLDACDEVGLYVMDETFDTWYGTKSDYDYGLYFEREHKRDVEDMIRMAYNHPCVSLYCIGNEIPLKGEKTVALTKELVEICHKADDSRPVLNAVNALLSTFSTTPADPAKAEEIGSPRLERKQSGASGSFLFNVLSTHFSKIVQLLVNEKKMRKMNDVLSPLDIVGFNYGDFLYEDQHKDYPERVLVGSETYPREIASYWEKVKRLPYVIGDFTWTAVDYLGEAGVGAPYYNEGPAFTRPYPCISAGCSNIDLIGDIKPQGNYFKIVYGLEKSPRLAVHPVSHSGEKISFGSWALTDAVRSWSWAGCEGKTASVDVYADANRVELFLNGVSLGKKEPKDYTVSYTLPYAPGELKAVSYDFMGKVLGEDILRTAEGKTVLTVEPEQAEMKADRQALCYVPVSLRGENGVVKATEDQALRVEVSGAAELVGFGSANPTTEDRYASGTCHSWYGRALAVLRATGEPGEVTIRVTSESGLVGEARIEAK